MLLRKGENVGKMKNPGLKERKEKRKEKKRKERQQGLSY